jgi:8-oxo-dGTP pyrophosphatase MutT (NUDIX family)
MSHLGPTRSALQAALEAHEWKELPALPGCTNHLRAGVLVPLWWAPQPVVLLTLRPHTLRLHAGEVCFPGGRPEPEDADLFATATREAREELGLEAPARLGRLSSIPVYTSDYRLEPFVAAVDPQALRPDPREVAQVLEVELADLVARPTQHAIPYRAEGLEHLSPVFDLAGHLCFGGTAHALYELVEVCAQALGTAPPALQSGRYTWEDCFVR